MLFHVTWELRNAQRRRASLGPRCVKALDQAKPATEPQSSQRPTPRTRSSQRSSTTRSTRTTSSARERGWSTANGYGGCDEAGARASSCTRRLRRSNDSVRDRGPTGLAPTGPGPSGT